MVFPGAGVSWFLELALEERIWMQLLGICWAQVWKVGKSKAWKDVLALSSAETLQREPTKSSVCLFDFPACVPFRTRVADTTYIGPALLEQVTASILKLQMDSNCKESLLEECKGCCKDMLISSPCLCSSHDCMVRAHDFENGHARKRSLLQAVLHLMLGKWPEPGLLFRGQAAPAHLSCLCGVLLQPPSCSREEALEFFTLNMFCLAELP